MNPDTTMAGIYTDLQGFGDMKIAARNNTPEAISAVATQFESLFVQTLLKSMRDASMGEGLFDSSQTRMYQDLYDKQLSLDLASRGDFGFSDMLVRQLGGETTKESVAEPHTNGYPFNPELDGRVFNGVIRQPHEGVVKLNPARLNAKAVTSELSVTADDGELHQAGDHRFESREAFIRSLYPYAQQAAEKLGVEPEVLLAQSALETGWGKHMMQRADGSNSYNLFGIKAGQDWQGDRVAVNSMEYEHGVARKHLSVFRAYDSYASSFADYAEFISSRPRYQAAIKNAADPEAYLRSLQSAGYATDPRYAEKIINILQREELITLPAQRAMLESNPANNHEG